jgi:hypothetical protein
MVKAPVEMHQQFAISKFESSRLDKSATAAVCDVEIAKAD